MSAAAGQKEQVIIGTAGHIDHGKTALVKALTGIDADTLAEEKRRGITIELGFVFMETPGYDKQIVFIDVPGHERLIKTMVAGASSVDGALLVVAADDGINAQTVEHFEILQLLGVERGAIALTKADLVDDERIGAAAGEIREFVAGTFLGDAAIVPVSSLTGAGVEDVRAALLRIAGESGPRRDSGVFRMPIDRVFTMPGFGTVIAGTILSGMVKVGDRVEILPEGLAGRVRGIQIHNESVKESSVGRRTAINIPDIKKESLRRGQCAAAPGSLTATSRLDARLHVLGSYGKELKNRARVRLHVGTEEVMSRVALLEGDTVGAGQAALAQLVLETPTAALPRDRFVIRTFSPLRTIGGGAVLDGSPLPHKRFEAETIEGLKRLEGSTADAVEQMFLKGGFVPQRPREVALGLGESEAEVLRAVEALRERGEVALVSPGALEGGKRTPGEGKYLHARRHEELAAEAVAIVRAYLAEHPYRLLVPLADVQSRFERLANREALESVLEHLCRQGVIYRKDTGLGVTGRRIDMKPGEAELVQRIEDTFREAGFATPLEESVREEAGVSRQAFENAMSILIEQGRLVRLDDKVTYHAEHLRRAEGIVTEHIRSRGSITVAELRDRLAVSRKYALALLEHFDDAGLTRRDGDKHVLRVSGRV